LEEFKNQVIKKHKNNKYAKQYFKAIKNVEYLTKI
jgi:quinol monooxygenase YgiN